MVPLFEKKRNGYFYQNCIQARILNKFLINADE